MNDRGSERCPCYTCLNHRPWRSSDNSLREGGNSRNKLYAPEDYLCPDARNENWNYLQLYEWMLLGEPQSYGYVPSAIVYEIRKIRKKGKVLIELELKWESSY